MDNGQRFIRELTAKVFAELRDDAPVTAKRGGEVVQDCAQFLVGGLVHRTILSVSRPESIR